MNETKQPTVGEIADYLSHYIFNESIQGIPKGANPNDRCQRIAFKGGVYPDKETNLGGLCRTALRDRIIEAFEKRPRFKPTNPPA